MSKNHYFLRRARKQSEKKQKGANLDYLLGICEVSARSQTKGIAGIRRRENILLRFAQLRRLSSPKYPFDLLARRVARELRGVRSLPMDLHANPNFEKPGEQS